MLNMTENTELISFVTDCPEQLELFISYEEVLKITDARIHTEDEGGALPRQLSLKWGVGHDSRWLFW